MPSKQRIDDRLRRIANVLLLNASYIDNLGLLNGKMGIAIFFYNYSRCTENKIFEDYAGELIDEIYEEINTNTPVNFENGLTGIGWGIEYLVKNKFVQADADEALSEIDNAVYRIRLQSPILISSGKDLFGYGLYYVSHIYGHEIDDNELNTLVKKYHLIFMADECERILLQKLYTKFNIESLSVDTINSLIWFLLEIDRLKIFPVKVEKVFSCIPEYLKEILKNSDDPAGRLLLLRLAAKVRVVVSDKTIVDLLMDLLNNEKVDKLLEDIKGETLVDNFIKITWQQLVYQQYFIKKLEITSIIGKVFNIIEDEESWTERLNKLTKDNLGLKGLAGLGLGLLEAQSSEHSAQGKTGTLKLKEEISK
jgi:hypothetical protein